MIKKQFITERKRFQIEEGILIFLLILSIAGIAITDFSPTDGYLYWIIMVAVFGLFAILIAWLQSKHKEGDFKAIIKEQTIHWITSLIVVAGTFLLQQAGKLTPESAGLVILLILSLATMLDGLRIGIRFSLVGLFLGSSSVIGAFYDYFIWIDIAVALSIIILSILWEVWIFKRANI